MAKRKNTKTTATSKKGRNNLEVTLRMYRALLRRVKFLEDHWVKYGEEGK